MKRSEHRILTTHTGSIQRPPALRDVHAAIQEGKTVDALEFARTVSSAVADVVKHQAEAGLAVINDGEMSRASYATYIKDRLTGFEGAENPRTLYSTPPDAAEFPDWGVRWVQTQRWAVSRPSCNGPIQAKDSAAVLKDIADLKAAAKGIDCEELFMTAISPASVANNHPNEYYSTQEEYLYAIADALHSEYKAIIDAGLVLQIDCVDLGGRHDAQTSLEEVRKDRAMKIDLINQATKDLPPDRMRIHVCWGAAEGPHHNDAPLSDFVDILLTARPEGLMVTSANGRHEHEWKVWKDVKVPDGKVIMPGVIDNTTNIIEHPQVVADRIIRFAGILGRENIIAGVDCGFSSNINIDEVDPKIAWAKLRALADGAALASEEFWSK
jgi:5-methyltetrahydropteroyltriglutamate--homocysteine methyltransferase